MIIEKDIKYAGDARIALKSGIDKVAAAVKVTLGPQGRNVVIERMMGVPHVTKDGVTVARSIDLADPVEQLGAQMVLQAATRTAEQAGDGTTTATILTQAMVQEGFRLVSNGANPMELRKGIEKAVKSIVAHLEKIRIPVAYEDVQTISNIGTIAANNDRSIGNLIAEAMQKVGKLGTITIDDSKTSETTIHTVEGMQFDRGWVSPYFVNTPKGEADFENPYILVYDRTISSLKTLVPLLERVTQAGRSLVIISDNVDGDALTGLVINKMQGRIKVCAVKAPGFGDRRKDILQDIAVLTGATFIAAELNRNLETLTMQDLGTATRVLITKENTIISGGAGTKESLDQRKGEIQAQLATVTSDYDREKLQERLSKLAGGVGSIRVGAGSESELKERKDSVEDALNATKAAIEEGIVAGGGLALIRCGQAVEETLGFPNDDQVQGAELVFKVLKTPFTQILENAGLEPRSIFDKVLKGADDFGYNSATERFSNLIADGVVDPKKVVRIALENAASVAGTVLTTEATITDVRNEMYYKLRMPAMGGE